MGHEFGMLIVMLTGSQMPQVWYVEVILVESHMSRVWYVDSNTDSLKCHEFGMFR